MMTEKDREYAQAHINSYYERTKDNLQSMIDAAQEADANMTNILAVPPPAKTFTDTLIINLFDFALQIAFPGWTAVSKAIERDVGTRARVLAGIVADGLQVQKGRTSRDGQLSMAKGRIAAINNMIAGLAGEKSAVQQAREKADAKLLERAFNDKATYTLAQVKTEIGEPPELIDKKAFLKLIYCFEYQLWQRYVSEYVTLKLWISSINQRIFSWETSGINKSGVAYITGRFTEFVATDRTQMVRTGVIASKPPGLHPILAYGDLGTVWFADVVTESLFATSEGRKISPALQEEIKFTSSKTKGNSSPSKAFGGLEIKIPRIYR